MFLVLVRIWISLVFVVRYLEKWVKLVCLWIIYLFMDENVCELFDFWKIFRYNFFFVLWIVVYGILVCKGDYYKKW